MLLYVSICCFAGLWFLASPALRGLVSSTRKSKTSTESGVQMELPIHAPGEVRQERLEI
jgi:hypothetical protein